jgi:hypothetical protein
VPEEAVLGRPTPPPLHVGEAGTGLALRLLSRVAAAAVRKSLGGDIPPRDAALALLLPPPAPGDLDFLPMTLPELGLPLTVKDWARLIRGGVREALM